MVGTFTVVIDIPDVNRNKAQRRYAVQDAVSWRTVYIQINVLMFGFQLGLN